MRTACPFDGLIRWPKAGKVNWNFASSSSYEELSGQVVVGGNASRGKAQSKFDELSRSIQVGYSEPLGIEIRSIGVVQAASSGRRYPKLGKWTVVTPDRKLRELKSSVWIR